MDNTLYLLGYIRMGFLFGFGVIYRIICHSHHILCVKMFYRLEKVFMFNCISPTQKLHEESLLESLLITYFPYLNICGSSHLLFHFSPIMFILTKFHLTNVATYVTKLEDDLVQSMHEININCL
jgi:hypothetical protein